LKREKRIRTGCEESERLIKNRSAVIDTQLPDGC
jgi:hypothetical protein